jgi:hypothetical protein
MTSVDVLTDVIINRPVQAVSAYAADPSNAPAWYVNVESAQWKTPMETTYTWASADGGATRMTLRNRDEPAGFARILAPFITGGDAPGQQPGPGQAEVDTRSLLTLTGTGPGAGGRRIAARARAEAWPGRHTPR